MRIKKPKSFQGLHIYGLGIMLERSIDVYNLLEETANDIQRMEIS